MAVSVAAICEPQAFILCSRLIYQFIYVQDLEKEPSWTHAILTVPQEAADTLKQTLGNKAINGKFLQISDITAASIEAPVLPPQPARPAAVRDSTSTAYHVQPHPPPPGAPTGQCAVANTDKPAQIDALKDSAAAGAASNSNSRDCDNQLEGSSPHETSTAMLDDEPEPAIIMQV